MQYIFINDFYQIFKAKYKYFLAYFIVILVLLFFELFLKVEGDKIFLSLMGIKIIKNNIIFLLLYLINIIISLFIAFNIFLADFKNSSGNIFLRILPKKWIIFKSLSCFFITLFLRILLFLLIFAIYIIINEKINLVFTILFIKNIFYLFFLQLLFVSILYLFNFSKCFFLSIIIIIICLLFPKILLFYSNRWMLYIFLDILFILFLIKIYRSCYVKLFERNGD